MGRARRALTRFWICEQGDPFNAADHYFTLGCLALFLIIARVCNHLSWGQPETGWAPAWIVSILCGCLRMRRAEFWRGIAAVSARAAEERAAVVQAAASFDEWLVPPPDAPAPVPPPPPPPPLGERVCAVCAPAPQ